ncbi:MULTISPECIES: hypothetical protein [Pseudomonas]|uniref:Uncharacterized protein n=2 Tax=Pseudomonas TaxID=286 RepID=A0A9Q6IHN1_9PSED|nr:MULTISPECIES: hypothetical protein [Pseudomonas]AXK56522.1 hypothetical protein DWF74_25255 [Pseudomonas protegens]MCL9654214.1 hypothetical protein [Pseudomonas protegens]MCY7262898.1 hypothetical protein [Pseudomonas protegens]MDC7817554.1 hypothetical protein [Pseudomonas sp. BLCC-B112]MDD1152429.1 hypothetical protein [Pseudomonas idahonensis]
MKNSITVLAVSATLAFTATVANASVHQAPIKAPQTVNQMTASVDTPFGPHQTTGEIQMASLASSCSDDRYSWWEYSGWEIVGCLISGQW